MPATSGYQAGVESNDVELSYGSEATWGVAPSTTFQAIRITGESLSGGKNRTRPNEMSTKREVAAGVTQQEQAGGTVNFALSYGTFDEIFACCVGADWGTALSLDSSTTDISFAASGNKMTSTLANKFTNIQVGQFIRVYGATASSGANNGIYRVAVKTSNTDITLAGKTVINETSSSGNIKIRGGMLRNGSLAKFLFFQKKLASNQWLRYPASLITGIQMQGGVNNFFSGSFTISSKEEIKNTADASTGGVTAAPTGGFHDAVAGFGGVFWNDTALDAAVDNVSLNLAREGAGMDYGMGSPAAQGAKIGQLSANGSLRMFFKNFTYYDNFKSETLGRLAFITRDRDGAAYAISLPAAMLNNPRVVAGGRDQAVMAEFDIEGNPEATTGTFQMDRMPATAA